MTDEEAKESGNFLENAIMSWTKHKQHLYLKSINEPIYGTKIELTARIIGKMPIKDAVEFTREYKRKIRENDKEIEGIESDKIGEITEDDMEKMEIVLKRKREESGAQIPNKINVQNDIRVTTSPKKRDIKVR